MQNATNVMTPDSNEETIITGQSNAEMYVFFYLPTMFRF